MSKVFIEDFRTGETLKRCSKCGVYKKLGEYHKNKTTKHGVQTWCSPCALASKRKFINQDDKFWKLYHPRTVKVGDCLEWKGSYSGKGTRHPCCKYAGKKGVMVRRIVYRLSVGDLPDDMFVVVTCGNSKCVRALHLKKISKQELNVKINNSAPYGERHGLRLHPERARRGERHGLRLHPECRAFGDRNGTRTCPDRVARGERSASAKITESDVKKIREYRNGGMSVVKIAQNINTSQSIIYAVLSGRTWKHVQ